MNVSKTAGNFEKEKSVKKNIKIFLILCVIAVLCGSGYLFARYQHTSPKRLPDRYGAKIPQVHSSVDKDNDGIDDQTDISAIEEWQGGDIVIFKNHIGIVSDRRNENGVPYVIHHNDPWQRTYEEDILEDREDIVGHYRVAK